jgi:hypothetical protein
MKKASHSCGSSAIFNTVRALQTASMVDGDFKQHKGSDLCIVFNIFDTICKIKIIPIP